MGKQFCDDIDLDFGDSLTNLSLGFKKIHKAEGDQRSLKGEFQMIVYDREMKSSSDIILFETKNYSFKIQSLPS